MNRLAAEASPYLRMHATNPVDWWPWGAAAFAQARARDLPIFLSIGYYTCHWCHVMERESFADPAIAALLNESFVAIKVDREERPDVDRVYMTFVQATSGSGGWPLSAFLTPDLKPFFGGTYFPPLDRHSHPSFRRVLQSITAAWREQRANVEATGEQISQQLREHTSAAPAEGGAGALAASLDEALRQAPAWAERLYASYATSFDAHDGGFGGAPKFPRPAALNFLQRYARLLPAGDARARHARDMAAATLRAMARGGIYDHLGGGFHRYATDAGWRVPHFEKMLYDQAQLAVAYVEAWQTEGESGLAQIARETLDFVLCEMTGPGGGFYSAQDADSPVPAAHRVVAGAATEGEGAYYLWLAEEITAALPSEVAPRFAAEFHVHASGNVPAQLDPQGEFTGRNILYRAAAPPPLAAGRDTDLDAGLAAARQTLYHLRRARPLPPTDDKVLAAWNGLMITALARAAAALEAPHYLAAAQAAANFVRTQLFTAPDLLRRWRAGAAAIAGFVEDYAFLIRGLLDLHQADFDPAWLTWAHALQQRQDELFWADSGGYYAAAADPHLLLRLREDYDGAEPSPNSVALENLRRLGLLCDDAAMRGRAEAVLTGFRPRLEAQPEALPLLLAAALDLAQPPRLAVLAGDLSQPATQALLRPLRRHPEVSVVLADGGAAQRQMAQWLPFLTELHAPKDQAAVYLCEHYSCQLPIHEAAALNTVLG